MSESQYHQPGALPGNSLGGSQDNGYNTRITRLEARVIRLEELRHEDAQVRMEKQAASLQANSVLGSHPIDPQAAFIRRLLNLSDLGYAVTFEVRNAARRALGMPEVKEYDL